MWLSSPAFWWPPLKENEKLNELFFSVKCRMGRLHFLRRHLNVCFPIRSGEEGQPVEFAAEYEGSWNRRCVARLDNYKYAPLSRLANDERIHVGS